MNTIHRSLALTALERYASTILFLIATAVLSRLLTPGEFGVYAVVSALTMVVGASFQEFGGANYLIQKAELTRANVRTAFTVTFGLSILFAAALFGARDAVAHFFGQEGLKQGIGVLTLTFLLSPFSITLSALLRRDMAFATLARCSFASNMVMATTSVAMAFGGHGFMAPAYGAVAGAAALVAMLMVSRPAFDIFRPSLKECGEVFRFGAVSSAVVMINVIYSASPQFILGRVLSFDAVGLYSRAVSITQLFDRLVVQVLNPVVMPAIADRTRAGGDLKRIYLASAELISAVQWPFLIFLALMAEPIVGLWLGPAWAPIVPLLRLLCLASLSLFAACLTYPVLVAAGRVGDTLLSSTISLPPSILILYLAAPYGVTAVAASTLLTLPLQAAVSIAFLARALRFSLGDFVVAVRKSALVAACSSLGPVVVLAANGVLTGHGAGTLVLPLAAPLSAIGWLGGLIVTRHPLRQQVREVLRPMAAAWRRRRLGMASPRGGVQAGGVSQG